jgi:hypothetical protein
MEVENAVTYYDTATYTAVKSFIVQAPGGVGGLGGGFLKTGFEKFDFI